MALRFDKKMQCGHGGITATHTGCERNQFRFKHNFKTFLNNVLVCYAFKTLLSDQCWQGVKKYSLYAENYALFINLPKKHFSN